MAQTTPVDETLQGGGTINDDYAYIRKSMSMEGRNPGNSQEYRDELAKNLSGIEDHDARRTALEKAKDTAEYWNARSQREDGFERENPLVGTADVVANLKAQFLKDPLYRKILDISYRDTGRFADTERYADAGELAMFVEARQKTINAILREEKKKLHIDQVVEIGAGLSTRSLQLAEDFHTFLDTDLKSNIEIRNAIVKLEPHDNISVRDFDVLDARQAAAIKSDLAAAPTGVVAEGVFTYFTKAQIDQTFVNLKDMLGEGGAVIFDIATQKGLGADRSAWSETSRELLQNLYVASNVRPEELAFKDLREVKDYFTSIGFKVTVADLRQGMDADNIAKYGGVSDNVKKGILEAPCIVICEVQAENSPATARFLRSSKKFYEGLGISTDSIRIASDKKTLELSFAPDETVQGYDSIAHGGYIASILDTGNIISMAYGERFGKQALNAHFEIDYAKPMALRQQYMLRTEMREITEGKKAEVISTITDEQGTVICTAKSLILLK